MKLKDYADTMFVGFNVSIYKNKSKNDENLYKYRQLTIASISSGFVDENYLTSYEKSGEVDSKYLTQIGDIIVCSKEPCNVILISKDDEEGILIPNNFIVIRNVKVDIVYLYNLVNISKNQMYSIIDNKKWESENNKMLSKSDLEDLELPKLNDKSIEKLSKICTRINNRQYSYNKLIQNDEHLVEILFKKEVSNYERWSNEIHDWNGFNW